MTQTIRLHNKLNKQVDIYSHPNNWRASVTDKDTRFKYSVYIVKKKASTLIELFLEDDEINDNVREHVEAIVNNVHNGYVYEIVAGEKIDETGLCPDDLYHSSYQKALDECMASLYC